MIFNILVVEDDPDFASLLEETFALTLQNIKTEIVRDSEHANYLIETNPLSLLILDVHLPNLQFYKILTKCYEKSPTKNFPIICMTGLLPDGENLNLINKLNLPILYKPFLI